MSDLPGNDHGGEPGKHQGDVDAIEADIARTRAQLAVTVDELTDRLDVKSRVKGKVEQARQEATLRVQELRDRATDADGRPTPPVVVGAVAAATLMVLVLWWRRRR